MMPKLNCSHEPKHASGRHWLSALALLLVLAPSLRAADVPALKGVLKDRFNMGVALNRGQFSGPRNQSADISQNAQTIGGGVMDVANQRLADQYANLFRVFLKHSKDIKLVTFWGVTDRDSWRQNINPLVIDGAVRPKPAFEAVINTVKAADAPRTTHTNGELPK